jgi:transposase
MPKPIPINLRRAIVAQHQAGNSLQQIAQSLGVPYESTRKVWRVYQREGRLQPNYAACGPQGVKASRRVHRAALWLKRLHPSWGAPLIRQVLADKWPTEAVPRARSLQRWFRQAGLRRPRRKSQLATGRVGRGKVVQQIGAMDSRAGIQLATGEAVVWLTISDEASGAVLRVTAFPPRPGAATVGAGGAAAVTAVFCGVGLTPGAAGGQWGAVGHPQRRAGGLGAVGDRIRGASAGQSTRS